MKGEVPLNGNISPDAPPVSHSVIAESQAKCQESLLPHGRPEAQGTCLLLIAHLLLVPAPLFAFLLSHARFPLSSHSLSGSSLLLAGLSLALCSGSVWTQQHQCTALLFPLSCPREQPTALALESRGASDYLRAGKGPNDQLGVKALPSRQEY